MQSISIIGNNNFVPASSPNFAYLSSGTWSLMGIEVEKPIINEVSFKN